MKYKIHIGDCLAVLKTMPDNSVDSVVTDPPYGLSFMGKKWDYDVPSLSVWAECLRVLKPGGYLLAFAGTRTQHRMCVRIEDAGFEIRDMIAWVYGSGFPKSLDVSKAIDKAAGADREVIGQGKRKGGPPQPMWGDDDGRQWLITAPATDAAKQWQGWGTALKPSLEPVTVARKPFPGTVADNVLEHGTGGLNIDGCRVGTDESLGRNNNARTGGTSYVVQRETMRIDNSRGLGRWPANLIHDGSDEVVGLLGDSARFFYGAKANKSDRTKQNSHPTVKPTDLMRYLCRLVTPPDGVVLDPYAGSGSTGKAAVMEGFRFIGIELNPDYADIANSRLASAQPGLTL